MIFATLRWMENYVDIRFPCSEEDLDTALSSIHAKDNPNIQFVYIAFDNDEAGQTAAQRLCNKLSQQNISACILVPQYKDWNEDLLHSNDISEDAAIQQAM